MGTTASNLESIRERALNIAKHVPINGLDIVRTERDDGVTGIGGDVGKVVRMRYWGGVTSEPIDAALSRFYKMVLDQYPFRVTYPTTIFWVGNEKYEILVGINGIGDTINE